MNKMIVHNVVQGSNDWLELRANYFTASEIPAAMSCSPFESRNDFIKRKAIGTSKEFSEFTLNMFAEGHRYEELARKKIAEPLLGDDLMQPTCSRGDILASFDGATMFFTATFEHKQLNAVLRKCVVQADLPKHIRVQIEAGLYVSGADSCFFVASEWDDFGDLIGDAVVINCVKDDDLRGEIFLAIDQVKKDIASYSHVETAPPVIVADHEGLPNLTIEMSGDVKSSNFPAFQTAALARIDSINTDLKTDEDFAIAKKTVKFLEEAEKRLEFEKRRALSKTESIDELFRAIAHLQSHLKSKRLTLDKLVSSKEASIKSAMIQSGRDALAAHIAEIDITLKTVQMPPISADFALAIKGKRNIESIRGAIDDLVAQKKIEANQIAKKITANLGAFDEASEYRFLFSDISTLALKDPADTKLVIASRIAAHKEAARAKIITESADADTEEERRRIAVEDARKVGDAYMKAPVVFQTAEARTCADVVHGRKALYELIYKMDAVELRELFNHAEKILSHREKM